MFLGGWMDGWVGGWMEVKAVLRIAYSNKQSKMNTNYYMYMEKWLKDAA
jgi:hypothetical protein